MPPRKLQFRSIVPRQTIPPKPKSSPVCSGNCSSSATTSRHPTYATYSAKSYQPNPGKEYQPNPGREYQHPPDDCFKPECCEEANCNNFFIQCGPTPCCPPACPPGPTGPTGPANPDQLEVLYFSDDSGEAGVPRYMGLGVHYDGDTGESFFNSAYVVCKDMKINKLKGAVKQFNYGGTDGTIEYTLYVSECDETTDTYGEPFAQISASVEVDIATPKNICFESDTVDYELHSHDLVAVRVTAFDQALFRAAASVCYM